MDGRAGPCVVRHVPGADVSASNSLAIGGVSLGSPVVQAALSGYSDLPMRVLARRFGAAYALCEVLLDTFVTVIGRNKRNLARVAVADEEHPVGGQLMGANPDDFPPAARRLVEAGFDVIDINFGCPVKKVLGRCRGGYLLGQPETALEIVSRVRDAVPPHVPVTLKMRRGLDDSPESADRFWAIFDGAFARGAAAITVHGRTVQQKYVGPSSWSFLAAVKRHAGERTVLGSGDLFSPQACVAMLRETGVDGVSVARGAIGNPWIFAQTLALLRGGPMPPPPSIHEQRDVLREHFRLAVKLHGEDLAGRSMRKFAIKYARLHPEPLAVRDAFVAVRVNADWQAVLARFYAVDGPGRDPSSDVDETAD
ncbi:MAG: tRNA-dihydrouridine synthase family protein, partial [Planctomycetia bacterium]|nr:tRNA-dihydrouridine synthase family protein [Planctomycetia bacterium]